MEHPLSHQDLAAHEDDEISSIRPISDFDGDLDRASDLDRAIKLDLILDLDRALDLELGLDIDAAPRSRAGSPKPVYARLYSVVAGERCDFPRGCFLGTRFEGGIIASATWEDELRAAFASEGTILTCRRYLETNAL